MLPVLLGHGAHRTNAVARCLDAKHAIEPRTIILPSDRGRQLDQLPLAEPGFERSPQDIRYIDRSAGHLRREIDHQTFLDAKPIALRVDTEIKQL